MLSSVCVLRRYYRNEKNYKTGNFDYVGEYTVFQCRLQSKLSEGHQPIVGGRGTKIE